jgi:hypothetical protein
MTLHLRSGLLLLLSCLFILSSGKAQSNFRNGYIVLQNKDTLRGKIDFREWDITPKNIVFLDTNSGKRSTYDANQLSAFQAAGESYHSFSVRIFPYSLDPVTVINEKFNTDPYDKVVFLRWITGGRLNLYLYKDSASVSYYFAVDATGHAAQLRIISRSATEKGETGAVFDNVYKNQLVGLMADCEAVAGKIDRTSYTETPLRKLFFAYNNCGKDTVERKEKDSGRHVLFLPMIGYANTRARFNSPLYLVGKFSFPAYSTFTGGVGVLFVLPRNQGRFSILTDVLYQHIHSQSNVYRENYFQTDNGVLNYNTWDLDIQFRYRFPTGKVRPFIQAGLANSFIAGNKSQQNTIDAGSGTAGNTTMSEPLLGNSLKSYSPGWVAGAGIQAGRFSLEARIMKSPGMSDLSQIGSSVTNFYFLAAFAL